MFMLMLFVMVFVIVGRFVLVVGILIRRLGWLIVFYSFFVCVIVLVVLWVRLGEILIEMWLLMWFDFF